MDSMKIIVLSGSTRPNSQSRKVADVVLAKLEATGQAEIELVDLHEVKLPVYDESEQPAWKELSEKFKEADGFVWVIPEWNGTAGPGIMNMLAYLKHEIFHKPVLPVSVSSGIGGAYPLAQIKAFGAKNSKVVFVPEPIRILGVKEIFNGLEPEVEVPNDTTVHERMEYSLKILLAYAAKLRELRQSGVLDERYTSGY